MWKDGTFKYKHTQSKHAFCKLSLIKIKINLIHFYEQKAITNNVFMAL